MHVLMVEDTSATVQPLSNAIQPNSNTYNKQTYVDSTGSATHSHELQQKHLVEQAACRPRMCFVFKQVGRHEQGLLVRRQYMLVQSSCLTKA